MRSTLTLGLAALTLALAAPAFAQTAPAAAPDKTFTTSAEVAALMAKAKSQVKPDVPTISQQLLSLAPYKANLEYRTGKGPAAVHETEAELFYVIDGAGVAVTGGKLTGEKRTNPHNLTGDGIEGGESHRVAKGDMFIVPQGSPHQIVSVEDHLAVMTFHVPRP